MCTCTGVQSHQLWLITSMKSLATEVILGHRRRARWLPGDTTSDVIRRLSGVDVHILRAKHVG